MAWWIFLIIAVASFITSRLLMPKPPKPEAPSPLEFPDSNEGRVWPVIFGREEVVPQVMWWGWRYIVGRPDPDDGPYWDYYVKLIYGLCWGRIDQLLDMMVDDKSLRSFPGGYSGDETFSPVLPWTNNPVKNQYFGIDAHNLMGGYERSGSYVGFMQLRPGNGDDVLDADGNIVIEEAMGENLLYRDYCVAVMGLGITQSYTDANDDGATSPPHGVGPGRIFVVSSNRPNVPNTRFVLKRTARGPLGDLTPTFNIDLNYFDCNFVYAIWEIFTNTVWGLGIDPSEFDGDSFDDAAYQCASEGLHGSFMLYNPEEADNTITNLLDLIDGVIQKDPVTGLRKIKLARKDWAKDDIPRIHKGNSSNLKIDKTEWGDTINGVVVKYRRAANYWQITSGTWYTNNLTYADASFFPYMKIDETPTPIYKYMRHVMWLDAQDVTSVTVHGGTGYSLLLVEGIDYEIDAAAGVIFILPYREDTTDTVTTDARIGYPIRATYSAILADSTGYKPGVASAENPASRDALGWQNIKTFDMPWITNPISASLIANRRLRALSVPVKRASWQMNREGWRIQPGDPVWLDFPDRNIDLVVRIGEVGDGTLDAGEMDFAAVEDVFDVVEPLYPTADGSGWGDPEAPF